jgi:hypothetical protein
MGYLDGKKIHCFRQHQTKMTLQVSDLLTHDTNLLGLVTDLLGEVLDIIGTINKMAPLLRNDALSVAL